MLSVTTSEISPIVKVMEVNALVLFLTMKYFLPFRTDVVTSCNPCQVDNFVMINQSKHTYGLCKSSLH